MKKLSLLFLLSFAVIPAYAQLITTSVPFLRIEPDSRVAGMGNAGVAVADNAAAIFWNPAGLAYQTETQFSITHANWLPNFNADIFYDYLVGTYHLEGVGTIGANVAYLNLGSQVQTDEQGIEQGSFSSYDVAVGASFGYPVNDNFSLGFGSRFIYSSLAPGLEVSGQETRAGTALGLDLGALYRSNPMQIIGKSAEFKAGFNLSNFGIGQGIQYSDQAQSDPLPTMLRVGVALTMNLDDAGYNKVTIAGDLSRLMAKRDSTGLAASSGNALFTTWGPYTYNNGQEVVTLSTMDQFMYGTGMEYWYNNQFALRFGYFYEHPDNGDRQYFTFGAGLRYNKFGVDFSYIAANEQSPLADTIRFSLLLNL